MGGLKRTHRPTDSSPMNMATARRTYLTSRRGQGEISTRTYLNADNVLGVFIDHVGEELATAKLRRDHIERWLQSRPVAPATKRTELSYVRSFCKWLVEHNHVQRDPTTGVKGPRAPRRAPRGLPAEAIATLMAECADERECVIATLMAQCGLRACEVAWLERTAIDLSENTMVVRGKGQHERELPIPAEARLAIIAYMSVEPAPAGPFIRSRVHPHQGISPAYVSMLMSRLFERSGVRLAPRDGRSGHALRHSTAKAMLRNGANLRDVQTALGHRSIQSTSIYVGLSELSDLRRVMEGRSYLSYPDAAAGLRDIAAITEEPPAATGNDAA